MVVFVEAAEGWLVAREEHLGDLLVGRGHGEIIQRWVAGSD